MVNMKIDHFVVGPVQTNCYFVTNIKTKEMIIIDPGACANQLAKKVDESGAKPVAILLTHGHFDHATDAKPLADRYGIKIYIHEADKATLDDPQLNVSYMMPKLATRRQHWPGLSPPHCGIGRFRFRGAGRRGPVCGPPRRLYHRYPDGGSRAPLRVRCRGTPCGGSA